MVKTKRRIFKKDVFELLILFCLFVVLQLLIQMSGRVAAFSVYKGVIMSLQYGICLLMMLVNLQKGTRIAICMMCLSILTMLIVVLHGGTDAIPGLANAVFYVITIVVISRFDIKRDLESRTDSTTGVNNRKGLYLELEKKISRGNQFAIINLRLSNFKAINDAYGHSYGDELLCKMSKRIVMRLGKDCIMARMGDAEFVVVVDGNTDARLTADRLLEAIRGKAILVVDDNKVECYIESFAGISNYPNDATDYESLIKYSDVAMTEAYNNKSFHAVLFSADMLDRINRQVYLRNLIKKRLVKDDFYIVYQPQFGINGKKLRGFESLIRMKATEDGEIISPGEFIPIAEKSDLIIQIDDWVLKRVTKEFRDIVIDNPELTISVNISAKHFADPLLLERVKGILAVSGFPANNLEIEITEYCMVNSIERTIETINALREIGVKIALDDFGTGYTSLNYVISMPVDLLKIDKSLIDDIENEKKRRDFARAAIAMGRLIGCEVISEGVENERQISCLKEDGCDFVQGFVWGKPLEFDEATKLAEDNR